MHIFDKKKKSTLYHRGWYRGREIGVSWGRIGDFSRKFLRKFSWIFLENFWGYFLGGFSLRNIFLSPWAHTHTSSNTGRHSNSLLIVSMNSSSSYKRAVARPRAFSRSSDIVWPPVTLYSRDIPLNVSDLICQPLRQMSEVTLLPLPVSAPMHVGERPTWLNTEDFSYEK